MVDREATLEELRVRFATANPDDPVAWTMDELEEMGLFDYDVVLPPSSGPTTKSFWVHWNSVLKQGSSDNTILEREAKRRSYILLNTWDHWMIPILKKHNPNIKVFVYKDASSTRSYDRNAVDLLPTGVSYYGAPDHWFLKDQYGNRIQYNGYGGHWLMDIGNVDYRNAWGTNVLASVRKYGFDGVFIDNLLWTRTAYGAAPAKYSTDTAFQTAYRGFLATVAGKFNGSGKLMLGNLSNARLVAGRWESYLQYLDGAWDEWWLVISDTDLLSEYSAGWSRVVAEISICEAAGKIALVQPHFTAGASKPFLYAWASYLCVAGDKAAIAEIQTTDGYGYPSGWHAEYDWDLGEPLEGYQSPATNIRTRRFERGVVFVNANRTGTANVSITVDGINVSIPGTSGRVVRR